MIARDLHALPGRIRRTTDRGAASTPTVRVAIYTRKSVDKGDGGEFGSIEAQRAAVEAYVTSQRGQGWVALPTTYDDLGESGANMNRPAFQRLLADVEAGLVDLVAVYRLDRLSRSQRDFLELMDYLERHGATFVSVTERFDTTTPMGRFALGITIQVAQLERETTALRVRDKVRATRRRGGWTGGHPPLGYDVVDGALVVNEAEAEQVREVFRLYLQLGSLLKATEELNHRGFRGKSWMTRRGELRVGGPWSKNSLRNQLASPVPAGKLAVEDELHEGQHEAIVDQETWDAVQALLAEHRPDRRRPTPGASKTNTLLGGLLRCGVCGASMSPHGTQRHGRKYVSYVCQTAIRQGAKACPGSRAPSHEIDEFVVSQLRAIGQDPRLQAETIGVAAAVLKERRAELRAQERQAKADIARLEAESTRLSGGGPDVAQRRAQIDEAHQAATQRLTAAQGEAHALAGAVLRKADLRDALDAFVPIWDELIPAERRRVVHLLLEQVAYHGQRGELAMTYRPGGVLALAAEGVS